MSDGTLASFIEDVCGESRLRVEADLGGGFVRLRSSEAERRQAAQDIRCTEDIVIEMLRNTSDAHAAVVFVACTRDGNNRRIVMIDNGDGVPAHIKKPVFEPRVTSKLDSMHMDEWGIHGRGMALYSIAVNAESPKSSLPDRAVPPLSKRTWISFQRKPTSQRFPHSTSANQERYLLGDLRTSCALPASFQSRSRATCQVVPGDGRLIIAASLYALGLSSITAETRNQAGGVDDLPICQRLAATTNPAQFAEVAAKLRT